jgi:hypothetical protein
LCVKIIESFLSILVLQVYVCLHHTRMPLFIVVHSHTFSIVGEAKQAQVCGSAPGICDLMMDRDHKHSIHPFFQKGVY